MRTAKERQQREGGKKIPFPSHKKNNYSRTREGLVVPGVAIVEVHVLGIAEESEVDGDEGLGGLRDERSFHDDTEIRERQKEE